MKEQILPLNPTCVWKFFYDICKIPHTSHNLDKISEYIVEFAKSKELSYSIDEAGNIVVYKPASKGMERRKGMVIQAHIDMVGQNLATGQGVCGSSSGSVPTDVGQPLIRVKKITVGGRS